MRSTSHLHSQLWRVALSVYAVVCIALDLFPRYQPPEFRYTGSDPANAVWSFGWPFALSIHDLQHGFFVGPFAYLVMPLQLGLLAFAFLVVLLARILPNKVLQPTAGTG